MKVKQSDFNKNQPPVPDKPSEVNIVSQVDLSGLEQPVGDIIKAINNLQTRDSVDGIILAIKQAFEVGDNRNDAIIKYLGDKIDALTKSISDRPTAFEFEVKRNNNGFISSILVKPVK